MSGKRPSSPSSSAPGADNKRARIIDRPGSGTRKGSGTGKDYLGPERPRLAPIGVIAQDRTAAPQAAAPREAIDYAGRNRPRLAPISLVPATRTVPASDVGAPQGPIDYAGRNRPRLAPVSLVPETTTIPARTTVPASDVGAPRGPIDYAGRNRPRLAPVSVVPETTTVPASEVSVPRGPIDYAGRNRPRLAPVGLMPATRTVPASDVGAPRGRSTTRVAPTPLLPSVSSRDDDGPRLGSQRAARTDRLRGSQPTPPCSGRLVPATRTVSAPDVSAPRGPVDYAGRNRPRPPPIGPVPVPRTAHASDDNVSRPSIDYAGRSRPRPAPIALYPPKKMTAALEASAPGGPTGQAGPSAGPSRPYPADGRPAEAPTASLAVKTGGGAPEPGAIDGEPNLPSDGDGKHSQKGKQVVETNQGGQASPRQTPSPPATPPPQSGPSRAPSVASSSEPSSDSDAGPGPVEVKNNREWYKVQAIELAYQNEKKQWRFWVSWEGWQPRSNSELAWTDVKCLEALPIYMDSAVEHILDKRNVNGKWEYFIHWRDTSEDFDVWVSKDFLRDTTLLTLYEDSLRR
ncbi:uncharacterized protein B0H18DRAFT_1128994 [Fomitopsis serialis]|uniref:uncharacterized protein n=1 Tax=Fomitopsis serialis TaxID=139415 RepID=UPI00200789B6|nr:uncharacterized protein B0H18DRAFT_1128994 [Neoantrodia serialis]KAH9911239.1 hypothetical protein B0H18DRAFT_1128994 [Neoantrodia serialis]